MKDNHNAKLFCGQVEQSIGAIAIVDCGGCGQIRSLVAHFQDMMELKAIV